MATSGSDADLAFIGSALGLDSWESHRLSKADHTLTLTSVPAAHSRNRVVRQRDLAVVKGAPVSGLRVQVERAAGSALGGAFAAATAVRRDKPIHNRGSVYDATLTRTGTAGQRWGIGWLDESGVDRGLVRLSRSVGLPAPSPDILGLALRWRDDTGRHELLLATTGMLPGLRHVLVPRRDPMTASYGSLVTYRTARTAVLFSAVPTEPPAEGSAGFRLRVATVRGRWQEFATLQLSDGGQAAAAGDADGEVKFDPVRYPPPGMTMSPAIARLREPAYRLAQRMRRG